MHAMDVRPTPKRMTTEMELTSLLDEAAKGPLWLARDGELFRSSRKSDIAYEADPERVRRILDESVARMAPSRDLGVNIGLNRQDRYQTHGGAASIVAD